MSSDGDQDVFEITDFTTISDWERFIAQFEELLQEWKLTSAEKKPRLKDNELATGKWEKVKETLNFVNFDFIVLRHYLVQDIIENSSSENGVDEDDNSNEQRPLALSDMMCMEHVFSHKHHSLVQWYGLRDFMVIQPSFDGVFTETKAKLLLSSATVAVNNTNCHLPVFIQIHSKEKDVYLGVCENNNVRTHFDMIYLRRTPHIYQELSGLTDLFKSKIGQHTTVHDQLQIFVSAKFTYTLNNWIDHPWPQPPPDMDAFMGEVGVTKLGELPYGACEDPVSQLNLYTTWISYPVKTTTRNLNPHDAPEWTAKICLKPNVQCLLFEYLSDFHTLCSCKESSASVLGHEIDDSDSGKNLKFAQALDRLTEPMNIPTISSVVSRARTKIQVRRDDSPIHTELLIKILQFIFPDAASNIPHSFSDEELLCETDATFLDKMQEQLKSMKSAPVLSLASRLALAMCHVHHSYGGLNGVAHLWHEFVLEMRYRWENHYTLPCLESGYPNLKYCILYQKLQMLNCCILRKKAREQPDSNEPSSSRTEMSTSSGSESDPEDAMFYECSGDVAENSDAESKGKDEFAEGLGVFQDSLSSIPEGRLRKCGDLKLLKNNSPVYIPVTQEPAPMTEDLLEEQAQVLLQLGTDNEGSQLRAKMQSSCLTSDMQSFKAANPNSSLEDFVRWYSPRDWIESEMTDDTTHGKSIKGHLSSRMMIPGNMWRDVWDNARPTPARKQKRLFDDTKEAEKVLHYLTSMSPAQVAINLFPMLIHSSLMTIIKQCDKNLPSLVSLVEAIVSKAIKISRYPSFNPKSHLDIIKMIGTAETFLARIQSVKSKFFLDTLKESPRTDKSAVSCENTSSDNATSESLANSDQSRGSDEANKNASSRSEEGCDEVVSFIYQLIDGKEVEIKDTYESTVGVAIQKLFWEAKMAANTLSDPSTPSSERPSFKPNQSRKREIFPSPSNREFVFRTEARRPASYSTPTPQRMHCTMNKSSFRIAGAFSEDVVFQ